MDYLSEARRLYEEAMEPYKGSTVGATEAEIATLEQEIGFALPDAYRQYLLWMGQDCHGIFAGSEWFLQDGYHDNELLRRLVTELEGLNLEIYPMPKHFFRVLPSSSLCRSLVSIAERMPKTHRFISSAKDRGMTVPSHCQERIRNFDTAASKQLLRSCQSTIQEAAHE